MPLINQTFSQLITFTRASGATYFDASGVLQTAATNVPRFDYNPATLAAQGLLIEEARTNSIRNNTMQGASAGVAPTNWTGWNITANGVTIASSAAGTENGIAYIDVAVSGTCTLTGTAQTPSFEAATQIAATVGQTWTESVYWTLVSGLLGDSSFSIRMTETDSGGLSLTSGDSTAIIPTVGNLRSARYTFTRTNANASTAFIVPRLRFGFVNGSTYNFTLRIGLPQLERGAFATSVIPTVNAFALGVTREADVASVNTLSPWYSATEGTLYSEATFTNTVSFNTVAALGDGTGANTMRTVQWNDGTDRIFSITASNVNQASYVGTGQVGTAKFAGAYKLNDVNASKNGSIGITDTTATIPAINALWLGQTGSALFPLNGWLRRVSYFPRRLANAELQSLTS